MTLHPDQKAALALIALAAVAFGLTYTFDEVPKAIQQGMGPERFPRLIAMLIAGLGLVLLVSARGRADTPLPPVDRAVYGVCAGGVAFIGGVHLVGMVVAMGFALLALGWAWGERRWLALSANAVLLPLTLWLLFVKGLKVTLPTGLAGRLLGL
jgi:small-conductance mechanosensitive channel